MGSNGCQEVPETFWVLNPEPLGTRWNLLEPAGTQFRIYNPGMTLTERRVGDITILDLKGRLVFEDGDDVLREKINDLVHQGRTKILLNLGGVTYMDSCGIGVLVQKYVSVRRKGGDVRLVHMTERGWHLMEITKLLDVFLIFESEEEAIASFTTGSQP
jgi:anti-sigma B factor antagonist